MTEQSTPEVDETVGLSLMGSTFAERAKAREAAAKRVRSGDAEDKAVKSSESKTKRARKKS